MGIIHEMLSDFSRHDLGPAYINLVNQAIEVFTRQVQEYKKEHTEILERVLGIGRVLTDGKNDDARSLMEQLRWVLLAMNSPGYRQPPDSGQLYVMMLDDEYPMQVKEVIATKAFGYASLEEMRQTLLERISGV